MFILVSGGIGGGLKSPLERSPFLIMCTSMSEGLNPHSDVKSS